MNIGFVGLGKMGSYMVERLIKDGHEITAFDVSEQARKAIKAKGSGVAESLGDVAQALPDPRVIWVMVPAGEPTKKTITSLASLLSNGDIVIDGGNSYYKDSVLHGALLKEKGIYFLDAGTSGGIWGLKVGYCLMVGGEKRAFQIAEPLFKTLAPKDGYAHVGIAGAGHFTKMVHNGIEYAMLEAYAEGFEVMEEKKEFNLDLGKISHLWNQGSVVRSWLLELAEEIFTHNAHLKGIEDYVADSGEGRWTVAEAINESVPVPVITISLLQRLRSRQKESFSAKVIAALRKEFGGHAVKER